MPAISIIIPVYNAEPYLRQCLDSVLAQTFTDLEIICVNDGSTDTSPDTLREYAARDSRIVVVDKENGGYGSAVNLGMAKATGEYIGFVEPDDFIEPCMYEDLYSFITYETPEPADIVKGSYWEFFDGTDGLQDEVGVPPLGSSMRRTPYAFCAADDSRVLINHPSVWSAIYRRAFLEEHHVAFKEIPGAGWVDNPFTFEVLPAAEKMVWVPRPYYFYRLTNEGASSRVKDYEFIFERLREMRAHLHDQKTTNNVWAAFYQREFRYIRSIISEYGFAENDEVLQARIRETLADMNPTIVQTHPYMTAANIRYFNDFLALPEHVADAKRASERPEESVDVTIVIPLKNNADYAETSLKALGEIELASYEVLGVDCASTDRTIQVYQHHVAGKDHYYLLDEKATSVPDGINKAIAAAHGSYVFIYNLAQTVRPNGFNMALLGALTSQPDVVLVDANNWFAVEAMKAADSIAPGEKQNQTDWYVSPAFAPERGAAFLFNCCPPGSYSALFRTAFLNDAGLAFADVDTEGAAGFVGRAALAANSVVYCSAHIFGKYLDRRVNPVLLPADKRPGFVVERGMALPGVLELAKQIEQTDKEDAFGRSLRNCVVDAFVFDLMQRRTKESLTSYVNTYFDQVNEITSGSVPGTLTYSSYYNRKYDIFQNEGLEGFLEHVYQEKYRDAKHERNEVEAILESSTMHMGEKVRDIASRVLPTTLVGRIRGRIARS